MLVPSSENKHTNYRPSPTLKIEKQSDYILITGLKSHIEPILWLIHSGGPKSFWDPTGKGIRWNSNKLISKHNSSQWLCDKKMSSKNTEETSMQQSLRWRHLRYPAQKLNCTSTKEGKLLAKNQLQKVFDSIYRVKC